MYYVGYLQCSLLPAIYRSDEKRKNKLEQVQCCRFFNGHFAKFALISDHYKTLYFTPYFLVKIHPIVLIPFIIIDLQLKTSVTQAQWSTNESIINFCNACQLPPIVCSQHAFLCLFHLVCTLAISFSIFIDYEKVDCSKLVPPDEFLLLRDSSTHLEKQQHRFTSTTPPPPASPKYPYYIKKPI